MMRYVDAMMRTMRTIVNIQHQLLAEARALRDRKRWAR
jgi:hypothetical protein